MVKRSRGCWIKFNSQGSEGARQPRKGTSALTNDCQFLSSGLKTTAFSTHSYGSFTTLRSQLTLDNASERAALPTARIHPFPMRAISPLLSFEYWPSRITARFESLIARAFYFIRTTSPLLSSSPLSISFHYLCDEVLRRLL
ncbi:hypothetical protein L6452_37168 [Arctium lappa]|uniref:Uncharacterized protein n=1 Tax=Arctium lappa TaxID=4217 RepID=A0ACB8Y3A1_ARCLA|nr:hypothetical protein L6452_37168 [Arctium lappa]